MSDYTMDELGRGYPARQEANRLRNEVEDLQAGAEHDHRLVTELEAENAKLREQNEALAKRIAHLDGLLEAVRRKHGFDTGEADDRS